MSAEKEITALIEAKIRATGMRPRDAKIAVLKENVALRQRWVEESAAESANEAKMGFTVGDRVAIHLPDGVAGSFTHGRIAADDGAETELRYVVELECPDGADWPVNLTADGSPKLLPKVQTARLSEAMMEPAWLPSGRTPVPAP